MFSDHPKFSSVLGIQAARLEPRLCAIAFGLLALITPTQALQIVGSMQVTGTVAAACSVGTTPLAFGTLSEVATTDTSAIISVTCTSNTVYDIGIGVGDNWSNQDSSRRMKHTATNDHINYAISAAITMTPTIGVSASNNFVDNAMGIGSAQDYTVYGRANAGSVPGNYTDTLVILVTY